DNLGTTHGRHVSILIVGSERRNRYGIWYRRPGARDASTAGQQEASAAPAACEVSPREAARVLQERYHAVRRTPQPIMYSLVVKIVIAPDSFKESLSAPDVAAAIERGVRLAAPHARTVCIPMADGGEGTVA